MFELRYYVCHRHDNSRFGPLRNGFCAHHVNLHHVPLPVPFVDLPVDYWQDTRIFDAKLYLVMALQNSTHSDLLPSLEF